MGVNQPKKVENAKILLANTHMDQDKVKVSYNIFRDSRNLVCFSVKIVYVLEFMIAVLYFRFLAPKFV